MKCNIIGAGGHSRSLIALVLSLGHEVQGVYDESFSDTEEIYPGVYLKGKLSEIPEGFSCFLAIGDNNSRKKLSELSHLSPINLIHKSAIIEPSVHLGESNQIFANAFVNACVEIGSFNILNTASVIEHEVKLGDFNHISVGAILCGRVKIGNNCFVGASATVKDKVSICDNVVIGAGAVVVKDITEPGTYIGVPAVKV